MPPSEWCQPLLRSLWQPSSSEPPVLSSEERRHLRRTQFKGDPAAYAPGPRELEHRAHEMRAVLAGDAAWDPDGLLALPRGILQAVSFALEHRGCRGLGLAEVVCLPFLLYSTDTVYILRVCSLMRSLCNAPSPCTLSTVQAHLGVYAGVVCALVESAALLRQHVPQEKLLEVLGMQTPKFLAKRQLVFRGVWLPKNFSVKDLCRCYNFTSWSLWIYGSLSVLEVYRPCVHEDCDVPVILVALRSEVMRLALPTTALYLAAAPDGKPLGKLDRPDEKLPPSPLRPQRSDSGAARGEKEILLPPFSHLVPSVSVPLAELCNADSARRLIEGWKLNKEDTTRIIKELKDAWKEATNGRKALRTSDAQRCVCLFIEKVEGSWFELPLGERPEDKEPAKVERQ